MLRPLLISTLLIPASTLALDLVEAISLARENDALFKVATAEFNIAREQQPQATAELLPQIDLNLFVSQTENEISNSTGGFTNGTSDFSGNGYTLTLSQPLFDMTAIDGYDVSKAVIAGAATAYAAAKQDLIIRVASAYFDLLAAQDALSFARSDQAATSRQLEQSTERFKAGITSVIDVKESQAQFDIASAQVIAAENGVDEAREGLITIIDQAGVVIDPLQKDIELNSPEPNDIEQWERAAADKNLRLIAASFDVTAARETAQAFRSEHYPTLSLDVSHSYDSRDGSTLGASFGGRDAEETRLILNLDVPLYEGGSTSSRHKEAIANLDRVKSDHIQTHREVIRQSRNAYRNVISSMARAKALKQALESTRAASEAIKAGFDVGARNSVDVLVAQRDMYRSERDYMAAQYDYLLNVLELKRAAGTLKDEDVAQINRWLQ